MRTITSKTAIGVVVLAVVGTMYWWNQRQLPHAPAESKASIRLLWLNQAQFAGCYTAQAKGFYKEEGVDVTLNPGGPDMNPARLVASGADSFGIAAGPDILAARSNGIPVVAIAVVFQKNPVVFFAKKTTGIQTPKDFVGKAVGIKYGFDIEYFFPVLLKKAGVGGGVRTVAIKYDMSQFFSGAIDVWSGYAINEPIVAEEKGVPINIIHIDDYGITAVGDTLFTTEKTIATNPSLVQKVVDATIRGWQWAIDHPSEAVAITLQVDPHLDRDHQTRMLDAATPMVKPTKTTRIGTIDAQTWAAMNQVLMESGFLKTSIDIEGAYTKAFVDHHYQSQQ
jgi:NitT/TauT family transport system substrate-binding protein